jgi:hypothetical protein
MSERRLDLVVALNYITKKQSQRKLAMIYFLGTNPYSQYNPCRIRHSNPIIIAGTCYPLNSILPCAAPEDLTLTCSTVNVRYFVCATKKNFINESDHDTLSIGCFDGLIIHSKLLFGYNKANKF